MSEEQGKPVTVSFVTDEEQRAWLIAESRQQGSRSISSLLRVIIEFYQKYHKLPESILDEARAKLEPAGNGC